MICSCCKNEYHDTFLSCPFCGTASSVTNSEESKPCAKCGAPTLPGQPICQQCGLFEPIRHKEQKKPEVTMLNVGEAAPAKPMPSARIEPNSPYPQNNPQNPSMPMPYPQQNMQNVQNPYAQNGQNPYQPPYQQNTYGQNPYNQNPYGQNNIPPYMQSPYQPGFTNPADPAYQKEVQSIRTMGIVALVFAFLIPLVTYILVGIASSKSKRINYTGAKTITTVALVIAIINHLLAMVIQFSS